MTYLNRTFDVDVVSEALKLYPYGSIDLDVSEWIEDRDNIAIEAEDGSIALFENIRPGFFDGHYFFKAKGRDAISLSHEILKELYNKYEVKAIRGFTPIKHKAAIWMSRKIGFEDIGEIDTDIGPCVVFFLNLSKHFKEATE